MSHKECEEDICNKFNQLIVTDDKFESNLTRFYCDYVLCLNKIYVDSIVDGYYEQCENYLKEFDNEEDEEKQFIKYKENILSLKGKEICEEVDPFTNNEFLIKKAKFYCDNIFRLKDANKKLVNKCKDYLEKLYNFNSYKDIYDKNNLRREILSDVEK